MAQTGGNREMFVFFFFFKPWCSPQSSSRLRTPFSQVPADIQTGTWGWAGLTSQQRQRNSGKRKEDREERERKGHKKGHLCLWVLSSNSESNGLEVTLQVHPRSRLHIVTTNLSAIPEQSCY